MWSFSVLCVALALLTQPEAQHAHPPQGKYSKVVYAPRDCLEVEWLPNETHKVILYLYCDYGVTSETLHLDEPAQYHYQVAKNSMEEYRAFIAEVNARCPYRTHDGDLYTFDYDPTADAVKVQFEGNTEALVKDGCPS
ncbi:hypothetical protein FOZ60_008675 [Perkinsus olseni]|uniref:Uncharacterized protein n=1 Tax=Perkinsus olseni TaxID=32597 RepID=A0A7J6NIM8_PEROL|nr:hypothetical protein FOZ60_008675 [Perkinsus olseni]